MTEIEKNYFETNTNVNVFLKVGSVFLYENAIIPAKRLSEQTGLPIEVLKREDYIKSLTEDVIIKNKTKNKK